MFGMEIAWKPGKGLRHFLSYKSPLRPPKGWFKGVVEVNMLGTEWTDVNIEKSVRRAHIFEF